MKQLPLHPFFFGVYPILALYAANIDQVYPAVLLRPILYVILGVMILLFVLWRALKDLQRGAIVTTLSLVLFFSYGHIYALLESIGLGRHRYLLPLWILILSLLAWWVIKRSEKPDKISAWLTWVGAAALLIPTIQITSYRLDVRSVDRASSDTLESISLATPDLAPDVYHILLDEYTREDVLKQVYDFDNSAFLNQLSDLGFYVAECSQSNYAQTELVLASLLNMKYLQDEGAEARLSRPELRLMIKQSAVVRAFERTGYTFVAFETGYPFSEFLTADYYFSPQKYTFDLLSGMNNFEVLLLKSTAGLVLYDVSRLAPSVLFPQIDGPLEQKRQRVTYKLDMLEQIPGEIPGPKYVFAHILLPHEPFVFDPEGGAVQYAESLGEAEYRKAYRGQIAYLNARLIPILSGVIESSDIPPVIILQGDTGPGRVSKERRMAILNALYLPDGGNAVLYDIISPINTYRLIFDLYFGAELPLLEDASYYSTYDEPFAFEVIPNRSGGCGLDN